MIGLGSNRLSVCRRGGMSVTQAGRGGMEWLGVRGPSWASPYSAQATAALKDAYPDLWNTLRQFGVDNPDKVPFINQYPLVAPYLLVDGLAFMVDCQYECSAALWKDLKGGEIFTGTGVSLTNGIPTFNGSARYIKESVLNFAWNTHTIEFAIVRESTPNQEILGNDMSGGIGAIYYSKKWQGVGSSRTTTPCFLDAAGMNVFTTLSIVNSSAYQDKSQITRSGQDYWSPQTSGKSSIGARYNGQNPFKGKIYAIRIYNRLLTEQEILANQAIDLQRWQSS